MTRLFTIISLLAISLVSKAELTVKLITYDPGKEIYELEGHTELHFNDPEQNLDFVVSWGIFDFNSPGFVYRYVSGETDYLAAAYPYGHFIARNAMSGRRITTQQLNLTADESQKLLDLVRHNLEPSNRVYRYNYVKDNCATRPLELIEKAVGGKIDNETIDLPATTWRAEMTRFHANYPWYQFGIDLALGSGIDKKITNREACYAPYTLRDYIAGATRPDGKPIVVGDEVVLFNGDSTGMPEPPTPWYLTPMCVALVLLAITLLTVFRDIKRGKPSRWLFTLLYGIATIEGLILTFLIFVSTHEATSPNWLYLWLNPLCAIGAVGIWLKKHNRAVYLYQIVNFAALILLLVIGIAGVQHLNAAFYPLIGCYLATAAEYIYLKKNNKTTKS